MINFSHENTFFLPLFFQKNGENASFLSSLENFSKVSLLYLKVVSIHAKITLKASFS